MTEPDLQGGGEIRWAKPNLTRDRAAELCRVRSPWPPFRKAAPRKIELVMLPHYGFSVVVKTRLEEKTVETVVDAVLGHYAVWRPELIEWGEVEPDLAAQFLLSREEAEGRLREDFRWSLIAAGLKLRRRHRIMEITPAPAVYYPFWVGYLERGGRLDFEVIDAVTGMRQGGKVRDAVLAALIRQHQSSPRL